MSDMDEEYEFEYEDADEQMDEEVDIENEYYNSKANAETDPDEALEGFERVVSMEPEKGKWGFKALKQTTKLLFKLRRFDQMMEKYREMLSYIKSAVTRNDSEKVINSILDFVSNSSEREVLFKVYETTLDALASAKNDRLWFNTNLKLGKLCFDTEDFTKLQKILKDLQKSCLLPDGREDPNKGTQLLEVYALEIQMYTAQKNNKKLKALYHKSLTAQSAIPHPRTLGVIRECGGKMNMSERNWEDANKDFFEAFKNYDEAGHPRRIQCLKYLVLANMLMLSDINPFDSQETKPYKNDPEIMAMTNLLSAYQQNDIREFEKILRENRKTIMDDPFIRVYIEDLLKNIRTQVLIKLIAPYTRIRMPFISQELNIPEKDVESLVVSLILDNKVLGHIDQVNQLLVLADKSQEGNKYKAIDRVVTNLNTLRNAVVAKLG